jgi:hypothetical protein
MRHRAVPSVCSATTRSIRCIDLARGHATGAVRDYNTDSFPIAGVSEQLLIVRAVHEPLIAALIDDDLPMLKAWFDKQNGHESR